MEFELTTFNEQYKNDHPKIWNAHVEKLRAELASNIRNAMEHFKKTVFHLLEYFKASLNLILN